MSQEVVRPSKQMPRLRGSLVLLQTQSPFMLEVPGFCCFETEAEQWPLLEGWIPSFGQLSVVLMLLNRLK